MNVNTRAAGAVKPMKPGRKSFCAIASGAPRRRRSGAARIAAWALCAALLTGVASAQLSGGVFANARACVDRGRLPAEICANADVNAAAEFDEKAPRFPNRGACEAVYHSCAVGFHGAEGWAGRKGAIYFTPQRQGFRVTVKSPREASVIPVAPGLTFSSRTAVRRDVSIRANAAGSAARARPGAGGFGVPTAEGARGPLPPPPAADPNFDCGAYLEPGSGDPATGCAPARKR